MNSGRNTSNFNSNRSPENHDVRFFLSRVKLVSFEVIDESYSISGLEQVIRWTVPNRMSKLDPKDNLYPNFFAVLLRTQRLE